MKKPILLIFGLLFFLFFSSFLLKAFLDYKYNRWQKEWLETKKIKENAIKERETKKLQQWREIKKEIMEVYPLWSEKSEWWIKETEKDDFQLIAREAKISQAFYQVRKRDNNLIIEDRLIEGNNWENLGFVKFN